MTERELEYLMVIAGRHAGRRLPITVGVKYVHVPIWPDGVSRYRGEHEHADSAHIEVHVYRRFPIRYEWLDRCVLVPASHDDKQASAACQKWFNEKAGPKL